MLNLDGKPDDADEPDRVTELLLPLDLGGSRVGHRDLEAAAVVVTAVLHGAFERETTSREGQVVLGGGWGEEESEKVDDSKWVWNCSVGKIVISIPWSHTCVNMLATSAT